MPREKLPGMECFRLSPCACLLLIAALTILCAELRASDNPVGVITRGGPDLVLPTSSTDDLPVHYGIGFPMQLGPQTAGLLCNLRVMGVGRSDYEDGTDIFVFDDLSKIAAGGPTVISRNEKEKDPDNGEQRFIVKYPAVGGFWPLGAKQPDGTPHPGAGKGFAICNALSMFGTGQQLTWEMFSKPGLLCYAEVMQLAYDGKAVSVVKRELLRGGGWQTPDGWGIGVGGMSSAIPDGSDLLMAVNAVGEGVARTGVCRFSFVDGEWRPASFTQIASGAESSLARRADGSLIFLTRPDADAFPGADHSIALWTSTDGGKTWSQLLREPNLRPNTPVSVNVSLDGTAFVLANVFGMTNPDRTIQWWTMDRTQLVMRQVGEAKPELKPGQIIRDMWADFGPPPPDTMHCVDHPSSAIVRLGDGRWHGLITYRTVTLSIYGDKVGEVVLPHTGCYVEEMPAVEVVNPPWRF